MFVTAALAQDPPAAGQAAAAAPDLFQTLLPFILIIPIFYFLILRPQQKRAKAQQAMLSAITRGDTVVTSGGIVGKVTKAVDKEDLEVEIAQGTRVKVARGMIADVRSKANPVNDNKPA